MIKKTYATAILAMMLLAGCGTASGTASEIIDLNEIKQDTVIESKSEETVNEIRLCP